MMRPATQPPSLFTLVALTGVSTMSFNLFAPSLPAIAESFETNAATANLALAGFLAATAVAQLALGPLADRYGRRPVVLCALGLFTLASIGCLLAEDIYVFLACRLGQSVVIAGAALSPAILRDVMSPEEAARRVATVSMAMAAAPMLAPILGGGLEALFDWRASFIAFTLFGAALFALSWADLGETRPKDLTPTSPIAAYRALAGERGFWGYTFARAFSVGSFYIFISGAPFVAAGPLHLPPAWLGVVLGSITAGFAFGSYLSRRLGASRSLPTMMLIGRAVACAGPILSLGAIAIFGLNPFTMFGGTIMVGLGNGLTMPSASVGVVSVRPDLAGAAAGLSGAALVGIGALLSALAGLVVGGPEAAEILLVLMLASAALAGLAALDVRRISARG